MLRRVIRDSPPPGDARRYADRGMVGRVGAPPSADRGAASARSSLGPHQKEALQGRSVLDDLWSVVDGIELEGLMSET